MTTTKKMIATTMKSTAVLAATVAFLGCGPERKASELRPGFDALVLLPFNLCTEEGTGPASLLVRNIGDDTVNIDAVVFEAVAGQEGELSSFDEPEIDTDTVLADDEALIQFFYRVPGGLEQNATLVITSDAEENPRLEVPVSTQELVPETPPDCG